MFIVCALYQFTTLNDFEKIRIPLRTLMSALEVKGTILLAHEGINGTIAGSENAIKKVLNYLQADMRFNALECKFSRSKKPPFKRLKVKLKKEIVTLGVADINPKFSAGTYVAPRDWNALINDPEVIVIDTRNDYEYSIGTFKGAINPNTQVFREFPIYAKKYLQPYQDRKIAMFCTGGIRCEKSTAYLKTQGFDRVYHLQGGILKYLEQISSKDSTWQGECFVFDDRVALMHGLEQGHYDQCHACRYPITDPDKQHPHYEQGVSCPHCFGKRSDAQLARYRERQKQTLLAAKRGEAHIGDSAAQVLATKAKQAKKKAKVATGKIQAI